MSIQGIVSLSIIIGAFVLFAAVLAWGDYQTRGISHPPKARQRPVTAPEVGAREEAARETQEPIHAA